MNDLINKILSGKNIEQIIEWCYKELYKKGAIDDSILQALSMLKFYYPETFKFYEEDILFSMGLFYKNYNELSTKSLPFELYKQYIKEKTDKNYTPIQSNILECIMNNKNFSFSAPTSTGKSYVLQDIIINSAKDVVIIVPSRALINEYFIKLNKLIKDKSVTISMFPEKINKDKSKRYVFILTPERCSELFKNPTEFNVELFLFDEAQLSDEIGGRGIIFDSVVRRVDKYFKKSKKIFAHPFIANPEAQLLKNHLKVGCSKSYQYKNVGKIFYTFDDDFNYKCFGVNENVMGKNAIAVNRDPVEVIINRGGSVLIYCKKAKIYDDRIFNQYKKYIDLCKHEIKNRKALKIIQEIKEILGASKSEDSLHYSHFLSNLYKGIVIHHGSLPLQVRSLIEKFTNMGYGKICFATPTLIQGINMPFEAVILDTFEASKPLDLKNLIGRAGRSSKETKFDFGIVVLKKNNINKFRHIMNTQELLDNKSIIEKKDVDIDYEEFKDSIINDNLSQEFDMSSQELERITNQESEKDILFILDNMFIDGRLINSKEYQEKNNTIRSKLKDCYKNLYANYLGRKLSIGEQAVVSTAIRIFIFMVYGKKFSNIVGYRYAHLTNKINKELDNNDQVQNFLMPYSEIPNKNLKVFPLYKKGELITNVKYDIVVYDTFDYIDKIIGFKLNKVFNAAFQKYYDKIGDNRALKMCDMIKYGTVDKTEQFLLKYGFSFEIMDDIKPFIKEIDENKIIFKNLKRMPKSLREQVERYC